MPWTFYRSTKDKPETNLYFGVELETALPETSDIRNYLCDIKFITLAHDCSIETVDPHQFDAELRFHPATWLWWMKHRMKLSSLLLHLKSNGGDTGSHINCGMHVHFSAVLDTTHLINVMHFIYTHQTEICNWSERSTNSMSQYSRFNLPNTLAEKDKDGNIIPENGRCMCQQCRDNRHIRLGYTYTRLDTSIRDSIAARFPRDHYNAVNITQHDTVEVRIFAGTLDPTRFFANLEFVKSVIEFTDPKRGYEHEKDCHMGSYRLWLHQRRLRTLEASLDSKFGSVKDEKTEASNV